MYRDYPTCSSIHLTSPNESSYLNATAIDLQGTVTITLQRLPDCNSVILKRLDDALLQVLPYTAMIATHRANMVAFGKIGGCDLFI